MKKEDKELSHRVKITPAKGRPMLHWVGKKPLDYAKGFPAQLVEVFDLTRKMSLRGEAEAISYNELKDNWHNLLFHGDNKDVLATLLESGFRVNERVLSTFSPEVYPTWYPEASGIEEVQGFEKASIYVYPNPSSEGVELRYKVPFSGYTLLEVYNSSGQRVERLVDGSRPQGIYTLW